MIVDNPPNPQRSIRAIGIARQSHGDGESVAQQIKRIKSACRRDGMRLLRVVEEQDVSGGTPLRRRRGLREAIEAVEAGEADAIVGAYFDRLVRSLKVQAELVERVEAMGGQVLALDTGQITNGSAGQWLSGTMLGAVSEYHRRATGDRVRDAHVAALTDGRPPYPFNTPGYMLDADRRVVVDPNTAPAVAEGFGIRARGGTIADVRAHLQANGIAISYRATQTLLASRVVLGELRFGDYPPNLSSHKPIVDRGTWDAVQRTRVKQGRKAKTELLLARLEVLRCGGCGRAMVSGSSVADGRRYSNYRCPQADHDCPNRQVISARIADRFAERVVRAALDDAEGRASALAQARDDAVAAQRADDALQGALKVAMAAGVEHEPGAVAGLEQLRIARDEARRRASRSAAAAGSKSISVGKDWDDLTLTEQRALVQAIIAIVTVAAGRGERRLGIELVG